MDGIINFLKPAMMTSHDAVSYFRRLTGIKKIGHTGTLDPMAVGVLPICIGKATRLIEYLEGDKKYRAIMKLGYKSETGDIWGEELEAVNVSEMIDFRDIEECLTSFKGEILQRVPGFSAQKHNGRKLYEYARAGKEIPIKEKTVTINNITVNSYDGDKKEAVFDVDCSKGTYIRTICTDAGEKLNTSGIMSFLIRTEASGLKIEDAVTMDELDLEMDFAGNIDKYLIDPGDLLAGMNKIVLDEAESKDFMNGIFIGRSTNDNTDYAVYSLINNKERLIGIGTGRNNKLKPQKVINTEY